MNIKEIPTAHAISSETFLAVGNSLANDYQYENYEYSHANFSHSF